MHIKAFLLLALSILIAACDGKISPADGDLASQNETVSENDRLELDQLSSSALPRRLNAADAEDVFADLLSGESYIIRFNENLGTLRSGGLYVTRYNPNTQSTSTVSVYQAGRVSEHANSNFSSDKRLSIWGAKLQLSTRGDQICLMLYGLCYATVLKSFSSQNQSGYDLIRLATVHFGAAIDRQLAVDIPRCPSNSSKSTPYQSTRAMADLVYRGSPLMAFNPDKDDNLELQSQLRSAIEYIGRHFRKGDTTSYTDCYGSREIQTSFEVIRALGVYYDYTGDRNVRSRIIEYSNAVKSSGLVSRFERLTYERPNPLAANAIAQYIHIGVVAEQVGTSFFEAWSADATMNLLRQQVSSQYESSCSDSSGTRTLTYGGWQHTPSDCRELISYHSFIVDSFLKLDGLMNSSNLCDRSQAWFNVCKNLKYNTYIAVSWVANLQQADGLIYDRSPSSSSAPPARWGTALGGHIYWNFLETYSGRTPAHIVSAFGGAQKISHGRLLQLAERNLDYQRAQGFPLYFTVPQYLEYTLRSLD